MVSSSSSTPVERDPVPGRVLSRELEVLGAGEERLGWDAAHVDARAAQGLVHLDANGGKAELRGANRGNVAPGPAADDDDVRSQWGRRHVSR